MTYLILGTAAMALLLIRPLRRVAIIFVGGVLAFACGAAVFVVAGIAEQLELAKGGALMLAVLGGAIGLVVFGYFPTRSSLRPRRTHRGPSGVPPGKIPEGGTRSER